LLSNPKFHLELYFIIKILLEKLIIHCFIFENINNLKKIIMASNRKSVVNDNRVEAMQFSWFTVPFIRGITEKFSRLNNECKGIVL